jgi:hypothetical protein
MSIVEKRRTRQLEIPVTALPNVNNEQLMLLTLGFKTVK